jgi:hypothetical protein
MMCVPGYESMTILNARLVIWQEEVHGPHFDDCTALPASGMNPAMISKLLSSRFRTIIDPEFDVFPAAFASWFVTICRGLSRW